MVVMRSRVLVLTFLILATVLTYSCTPDAPSPRAKVLEFVRLIQSDTLPDIRPFVDLDSVAAYQYEESKYDTLSLEQKRQLLLAGFVGNGEYRGVWSKSQIVVNEEFIRDDTTANVEVSFIDRSTRIQYYSQMGLKLRGKNWVIVDFKVN